MKLNDKEKKIIEQVNKNNSNYYVNDKIFKNSNII